MSRYNRLSLIIFSVPLFLAMTGFAASQDNAPLAYPKAKTVEQVDDYHGTKVADPYRWLEDPDSADTRAWVEAENTLTFGWLAQVSGRERIKDRLTKIWNYERFSIPYKVGGRYFYSRNSGLQNQSVLYTVKTLDSPPTVLLDPNTLSADGTVALAGMSVSEDGKLLAYALSVAGSDWSEWHVREVDSGKDLPDRIQWVKFSGASWTKDGKGFYYSRYDQPDEKTKLQSVNYNQKLFYHRIGQPQEKDTLVYQRPDHKEWQFGAGVTDDGRYLLIDVNQGTERKNLIFYQDLRAPKTQIQELISNFEASYIVLGNVGPTFYLRTDLDAPRGRVIRLDLRRPDKKNWKEILPQSKETLMGLSMVGGNLVASYLKDAYTQVRLFDLKGKKIRDLQLPGIGSAGGFGGRMKDTETFYSFTGYTTPPTIYRYDLKTGRSTMYRTPKVEFNPAGFETKQVFYQSKDGTRVPMFITHRKGLKLDGSNPTILYGYGGFSIPSTPYFSIPTVVWMEMGGVYAVACIRGGGEYGEEWHQAGIKSNKQNVFDDFIAGAEWLIANKYTSTPKLAIYGGSNGGLLVGACLTQRPDLFGAAMAAVGVMDMLRFHKFTIGWGWVSDFGCSDNPDEFKVLYAYSPLHKIKPGTRYPATFITTADHDDRVVPAHSFKFTTTLQSAQAGPAPVLIRIETKAGHGGGKPMTKTIEETADRYAFLMRVLNIPLPF